MISIHQMQRHIRVSRPIFIIMMLGLALTGCGGGGSSASSGDSGGMVITGFTPASGAPGSSVIITGAGFPSAVQASFAGINLTVDSVTPTQVVVTLPIAMPDTTAHLAISSQLGSVGSTQTFSVFNNLYHVAHSSTGDFVAFSRFETLLTSSDGINWTEHNTNADISAIAFSGSTAVGVGMAGGAYTSTDLEGWTPQPSATPQSLFAIARSNSAFVAVGDNGAIVESPDGVSWSSVTSPTTQPLTSLVWSGTQFVACGQNGVILNSPDGITWNLEPLTSVGASTLTAIVFGNGSFVIAGGAGPMLISTDGISWTPVHSGAKEATESMTWSGTRFVAVGDQGEVLSSSDGVNWSEQILNLPADVGNQFLGGVVFHSGLYVAVGGGGTIVTSTDGTHWTLRRGG